MSDKKVQWHPGFVAAMILELAESRDGLIFEKEYNLNTKPLEIDLLVIKKETSVQVDNEIGAFFRGHNIMEYKSPEDHLNIDSFYKALAYASLYKSYGRTVDEIKADDITISLFREAKPEGLFRYFAQHGYLVSNRCRGIYLLEGTVIFPIQIVVTGELDKAEHVWLGALSEKLRKQDLRGLLEKIQQLSEQAERELADSVLEVSIGANRQALEELKGDANMCQALMEIMEPQLLLREKAGLQKGIQGAVEMLRKLGHEDQEIKATIMEEYGLSAKEADGYF
ncbi:MAG: hypothetical protein HFJ04_00510 [Lachnospiraceae bacterium]|nr:hypothetical protein [Lachnospiraceae bacterium]